MIVITGTEIVKNIDFICLFVTIFDFVFITERAHSPAGDHVNIEKPAENSEYSVFTLKYV